MPVYVSIERDIQGAIERWENEGGWSIHADSAKERGRENNGARPSREGAAVKARSSPEDDHRVAQGASVTA